MEIYLQIASQYVCIRWDADSINDIVKNMFSPWHVSSAQPTYFFDISSLDLGFSLETPLRSVQCSDEKVLAAAKDAYDWKKSLINKYKFKNKISYIQNKFPNLPDNLWVQR